MGGKGGGTKTKEWGLVAWVLSEYVMTVYARGEHLVQCLLLGKQRKDRGRAGIASSGKVR